MPSPSTRFRAHPDPLAALWVAALALAFGCSKRSQVEEVPVGELEIADTPRLVTGPVGVGAAERDATYVLIDVTNNGDRDAVVALGGELFDAAEVSLGPVRTEVLRIPAAAKRMFALVDAEVEGLTNAVSARVEVVEATRPPRDAPIAVTGPRVHPDQGRAVIEGMIENTADKAASVVVLGAFYDGKGAPMMRRTTVYRIDAKQRRSAQFVGPPGSVTASLFIGDVDF